MASDVYRWLAKHYDHLFEYRRSFDAARELIVGPILRQAKSVCDLGCGTGTTALLFANRGLKTFAVDLSPDMCRAARRKARQAQLPLKVIQADMRDFSLPQRVDLITCEFDALNHIPRKTDLRRVAKSVAMALNPGGYFAFDLNNRLAFERIWSNTWFIDEDPIVVVMHGGHKRGTDRAWTDVEWFIRHGNCWRRRHEYIEEICWARTEIRNALSSAGFGSFRTWDAAPFVNDSLTRPGNRTFWLARLK